MEASRPLTWSWRDAGKALMQPASRQQFLHHAGLLDACQALIQSLIAHREPAVVEAQQMQDRGMEVADVHGVLDDVVGEIVGLAVDRSGPGAAAGHPHGEAARVMIAAVVLMAQAALGVNGPAKLTSPDHEGGVIEAAALQ